MALGDIIANINPMDFVTGYERGLDVGRKRQQGEQEELRTQIMRVRDLPAAQVAGGLSEAELEVLKARRPDIVETFSQDVGTRLSRAKQRNLVATAEGETLPGRLEYYTQASEQARRMIPQRLERNLTEFNLGGERQKLEGLQTEEQMVQIRDRADARGVQKDMEAAVTALEQDPAAQNLDDFEKLQRAPAYAQDPRSKQLFRRQANIYAADQINLAARGGNVEAINAWMERVNKPFLVTQEIVTDNAGNEKAILAVRSAKPVLDSQGNRSMQPGEVVQVFSMDETAGPNLTAFLGLTGTPQPAGRAARRAAQPKPAKPAKPNPQAEGQGLMGPAPPTISQTEKDLTAFGERQARNLRGLEGPAIAQQKIAEWLKDPLIQQNQNLATTLKDIANRNVALDPLLEQKVRRYLESRRPKLSIGDRINAFNMALTEGADARALNLAAHRELDAALGGTQAG